MQKQTVFIRGDFWAFG